MAPAVDAVPDAIPAERRLRLVANARVVVGDETAPAALESRVEPVGLHLDSLQLLELHPFGFQRVLGQLELEVLEVAPLE